MTLTTSMPREPELAAQPADDLLGRIAPGEIFLHLTAQPLVDREL